MGPFEGVVFDCDGVLVDSEPLSLKAWRRALAAHGYQLVDDDFHRFVGSTDRHVAEHFAPLLGVEVEALASGNVASVRATLDEDGLDPFPDTMALLERLDGMPVAVGSNSTRWRLEALLEASGLRPRFDVSVAGDEVPAPKPAPDVYRLAIERLGLRPAATLVIEDSPPGIASARAAGATVVAVQRGMFERSALAAADAVVTALA